MRDQNRLRSAQMGVGRHQRVAGAVSKPDETSSRSGNLALDRRHPPLQVQPQVDGDLFVTRSPGMQSSSSIANPRDEFALDEGVDILVAVRVGHERRIRQALVVDRTKTGVDRGGIRRREHAGTREPRRPRQAPADIILEQPAIEAERRTKREEIRIGIARKPS